MEATLLVAIVALYQFIAAVFTLFNIKKLTHLHAWQFFILADWLQPLNERPRGNGQKVGPTPKHDYLHHLFFFASSGFMMAIFIRVEGGDRLEQDIFAVRCSSCVKGFSRGA